MKTLRNLAIVALVICGQSVIAAEAEKSYVPTTQEIHNLDMQLTKELAKNSPHEQCILSLEQKERKVSSWADATEARAEHIDSTYKRVKNELQAAKDARIAELATKIQGLKASKMRNSDEYIR